MDEAGVNRVLARGAAALVAGMAVIAGSADAAGAVGVARGLFAADINDTAATLRVQMIAAGLAIAGIAVAATTIWWWRSTKPHHGSLGPLEVMSARRWAERPANQRNESLDAARPQAGAHPVASTPSIDLSELAAARSLPSVHDGGGFGDLADLAVPADGARAAVFNQADHTDWSGARPVLADRFAAEGLPGSPASGGFTGSVSGGASSLGSGLPGPPATAPASSGATPAESPPQRPVSFAAGRVDVNATLAALVKDFKPAERPAAGGVIQGLGGLPAPTSVTGGSVAATGAGSVVGNSPAGDPSAGTPGDSGAARIDASSGVAQRGLAGSPDAAFVPSTEPLHEQSFRPFRRTWMTEPPLPPPDPGAALDVQLDPDNPAEPR